jgi:hypothetical protein
VMTAWFGHFLGLGPLVLVVCDMFEPGHYLTGFVGFLHGDVRHETSGCRPMPVLFTRLDVDDVTRADLLYFAASPGHEADAISDIEGLALGVVMPRGTGAWTEANMRTADR